jgi:small subunit ribosomal protein S1
VHISELAQHHVENPREVVSQGDLVNVKIIEVDAERRRLSLSLKRIEDGEETQPLPEGAEPLRPAIDLSEDVFAEGSAGAPEAPPLPEPEPEPEPAAVVAEEPEVTVVAEAPEAVVVEELEAPVEEPEAVLETNAQAEAEIAEEPAPGDGPSEDAA